MHSLAGFSDDEEAEVLLPLVFFLLSAFEQCVEFALLFLATFLQACGAFGGKQALQTFPWRDAALSHLYNPLALNREKRLALKSSSAII